MYSRPGERLEGDITVKKLVQPESIKALIEIINLLSVLQNPNAKNMVSIRFLKDKSFILDDSFNRKELLFTMLEQDNEDLRLGSC